VTRRSSRAAFALLALAAALHALLLARLGAHQVDLDHDSTISHLAATGHQDAYDHLPTNMWIPASEIQRLFQIDEGWPLRRIRDDLARTDIHPPLYFWLLHAQFLTFGTAPWASLILNGLLGLLTLLTIHSIGRRLFDAETAAGAALLWAVSYGALLTAGEARPYALAALLATLLVRLALAVVDREGRPSPVQSVLLAAVMALGLLTHYHFSVVIAAVGIALVIAGGRARGWALIPPALAALVALLLVHPGVVDSLRRQRLQAQAFTWDDFLPRLRRFASGLEGLARPADALPALGWLCAALVAFIGVRAWRSGVLGRLGGSWNRLRAASPGVRLVAGAALATVVLEAALYLGHVSPAHAVGGRYNAALWPLVALLVAGAARDLCRDRATLPLLAIAVALLSYQVASRLDQSQRDLARSPAWHALASARAIVADHYQRGVLPRTVLHVPPGTPVWIVRDPAGLDSLPDTWRRAGVPITFVLAGGLGDTRVPEAVVRAAGDRLVDAGPGPGGVDVRVWTPR
jgi:4-amino-4-deoxy-L-arabinose transferase-like glycosyltransferase